MIEIIFFIVVAILTLLVGYFVVLILAPVIATPKDTARALYQDWNHARSDFGMVVILTWRELCNKK